MTATLSIQLDEEALRELAGDCHRKGHTFRKVVHEALIAWTRQQGFQASERALLKSLAALPTKRGRKPEVSAPALPGEDLVRSPEEEVEAEILRETIRRRTHPKGAPPTKASLERGLSEKRKATDTDRPPPPPSQPALEPVFDAHAHANVDTEFCIEEFTGPDSPV